MKNFSKILAVAALLSFAASTASYAAVEIKLSHSGPTPAIGATNDEGCKAFKEYVEAKSNGEITVKIFPNNQLGNEREQFEGVQMGTIQMCSITTGTLSTVDKQILALDIPYLFPSKKAAYTFLDGPMGTNIREAFSNKTGTVMLAFGENGFRHFTNNVRPIKTPEDLKGLKIRVMENPAHIEMLKAMGATPTPIPYGELYTALSQGVVDGQENPVSLTESSRLHEVQKYLSLDGHLYSPFVLIINGGVFNKLSPELQQIVRDGAKEYSDKQRSFNDQDEKRAINAMKEQGVQITELTVDELNEFAKATQTNILPMIEKELGADFVGQVMDAAKSSAAQ